MTGKYKKMTPANAVLTTFLNLSVGWAPCCCFRLSTSRRYGMLADMHTANKERLPVPRCWLKKRMLNTHIAGDYVLFLSRIIYETNQFFRSAFQLTVNTFFYTFKFDTLISNV